MATRRRAPGDRGIVNGVPKVWIVGDASRAEMRAVLERLPAVLPNVAPVHCADLTAVESQARQADALPDLLLVCESWPDEFPGDHVTRLLAATPLARVVCLAGAWCEATGRTRSHWPPALRVPIWAGWQRIEAELCVLRGELPAWPWTATRDEVWLTTSEVCRDFGSLATNGIEAEKVSGTLGSVPDTPTIRIEIVDAALAKWFSEEFGRHGWSVTSDAAATVSWVLLSAEPSGDAVLPEIAARCRQVAPARVLAITTWPLPEWSLQLVAAGVQAVWNPLFTPLPQRGS
jgi:hypothetical protein